jgi:kynurenine formamidase
MRKQRRFVDLSLTIESGLPCDPPDVIPKIEYLDHKIGAGLMKNFLPGITEDDLPDGLGWAVENITLNTHSGTHMDAPYHYHPYMDGGKPSLTIDEIPLEWCFGEGVLLDFRHKADGDRITVQDVEKELKRIDYKIKPLDIVLIHTGAESAWGTPSYMSKGAGMTKESTMFFLEKGVRLFGIDAWSFDRPLPYQAKEFQQNHDSKVIWEAHYTGIDIGYCHMEKMANLGSIGRSHGFKIACFPVKIKRASAGWVRPVAIISEGN